MKLLLRIITVICIISSIEFATLEAVERLASGLCTHYEPKFVRKPILDENGNQIGEKQVIDIGNGQEIAAGDDWDSSWLASNDDRITFDYDIKTRREYRCNQINIPSEKQGLAVECHRRGFDYGFFTNGSEQCFSSWDFNRDYGHLAEPSQSTGPNAKTPVTKVPPPGVRMLIRPQY